MERRRDDDDERYRFVRRPALSTKPQERRQDGAGRAPANRADGLLSRLNNGDPPDLMLWGDES